MKANVLFFIHLTAFLGAASGLSVGPVRLCNEQRYLHYSTPPSENTSLIECPYQLTAEEEVKRVYWEMWDDAELMGTYNWDPVDGGKATGILEGVVEMTRDDGGLQLTKLRYDMAGDYLCGVELTNGQNKSSSKEEVLVVDNMGASWRVNHFGNCGSAISFKTTAMYPEPTLKAGMFSAELNEYYEKITQWNKIYHSNGSVTCFIENAIFKIDENSPEEVFFKVDMGVSKSDGMFISFNTIRSFSSSWNEHGCPDVKEKDHKGVRYFPANNVACRGGQKNMTEATVTCQDGYRPAGSVSIVVMRCNSTTRLWQLEEGTTATSDDLECVAEYGDNGNDGNKEDFSTGCSSPTLLSASLFGVVLLFISSRL
ncbi:uncharacterized protein LOC123498588 isoform X1 [Portunus trituberculatus]|uniref:uncharacterized protein LOC123498588 isoform X1 n=1 Tax=Portunus trituberculatus TaxID=210409 RepID=UPI001E1CBF48|nr:uncharacterized protein LOC123498588 isoform X1 [Portunus trituberculatus]